MTKLTYEQICSVTLGAAYTEQTENGVRFHRFTKDQEEAYKAYSQAFYDKVFATTGIRLEFMTDSRLLTLAVRSFRSCGQNQFSFSVLCNETVLEVFGSKADPNGAFRSSFALPEGENKICVCFPWSSQGVLEELSLDAGSSLRPIKKKCRLIQFGDSITHGVNASEPHLSYASIVATALAADARNKAIGGDVFFPALASLVDDGFDPDYITVAYGTNDWSHSQKEVFDRDCRQFYHNLSAAYSHAKIFAIAPIWRGTEHLQKPIGKPFSYVADYIQEIANELPNVICIRGYDLVPHDASCFQEDLLHPNDKGFFHYAENLLAEMNKHIEA